MSIPSIFIISISGFLYICQSSVLPVVGRSVANEAGTASLTRVTHFAFLQNLGNPCGVSLAIRQSEPELKLKQFNSQSSPKEFYQSMLTAILIAIQKQQELQNADPNLGDCGGLTLKSLPPSPSFTNMNVKELYQNVYKTGIFLAAHLHIMALDRQTLNLRDPVSQDYVVEDPNRFSDLLTLNCGNESDTFLTLVRDLTAKIEDILCTLVERSNREERSSYRGPYNSLLETNIYRYHSSCSLLRMRDCLVLQETNNFLNNIFAKFDKLVTGGSMYSNSNDLQFESQFFDIRNDLF